MTEGHTHSAGRPPSVADVPDDLLRLRAAVAAAGLLLSETDVETGAVWLSPACAAWLGCPATLSAAEALQLVHPDDRHRVGSTLWSPPPNGGLLSEHRVVTADGTTRWVRVRGAPLTEAGAGSSPRRYQWVTEDITALKHTEHTLRDSEERWRRLAGAVPQLVWIARDDGLVTYYNERARHYDGLVREADGAWRWQPIVHDDDRAATLAAWQAAVDSGERYECEHRVRMHDGTYRWHLSRADRLGEDGARQWYGTATDVHDLREANDALRASEERLRMAAEAARFGVYDVDVHNRRLVWSETLRELVGVEHDAPVALETAMELIHDGDRARVKGAVRHAVASGRSGTYRVEYRITRPDGATRWVSDTGRVAVEGPANRVVRIVGTVQDVTEAKQAEIALRESETRFRIMADETPVVIWVTDATGEIQFINRAYRDYFGVSNEEVLGPHWQPMVHPEDGAYIQAFLDALRMRAAFRAEARVRRGDGEWRWVASYGTPRHAGDHTFLGLVGVTLDITEEKRARELERDAVRQKDQFIAVLAHELRNPLAPIRTAIAMLRAKGPPDPLLMRCRDVIDRQAEHMGRLLDDLLDVSRLSRGEFTLQRAPVSLRDAIEAAVDVSRPLIDQAAHALTVEYFDDDLVLDADAARIIQVVANLLNNAATYTPHGGRIRVEARADGTDAVVIVRDSGVGIPSDRLGDVFQLFTRIPHPGEAHVAGLGIGLALARRLVEMHGGAIRAESGGPGLGSTFTVRLPIGRPRAATDDVTADWASLMSAWGQRRVLVADDNADAAEMLALFFEQLGSVVLAVSDGAEAVAQAEAFRPAVVLLDLGMPRVDGYEACRRLRQEPWAAGLLIIALTGWGQEQDRRRTTEAGFDAHVVKPIDPVTLVRVVYDLDRRRS